MYGNFISFLFFFQKRAFAQLHLILHGMHQQLEYFSD